MKKRRPWQVRKGINPKMTVVETNITAAELRLGGGPKTNIQTTNLFKITFINVYVVILIVTLTEY